MIHTSCQSNFMLIMFLIYYFMKTKRKIGLVGCVDQRHTIACSGRYVLILIFLSFLSWFFLYMMSIFRNFFKFTDILCFDHVYLNYSVGWVFVWIHLIPFGISPLFNSDNLKPLRCSVPYVQVPFTPLAKPTGTLYTLYMVKMLKGKIYNNVPI